MYAVIDINCCRESRLRERAAIVEAIRQGEAEQARRRNLLPREPEVLRVAGS